MKKKLAIRASLNFYEDPGFVDYNYVVREPGISQPDIDWTDSSALANNFKKMADANGETTTTGRVSVRWKATDWLDATLNYFLSKTRH